MTLLPAKAVLGFYRTGVYCQKCTHECTGFNQLTGMVYCEHDSCPAWWDQGEAPKMRDPENEKYNMNWLQANGYGFVLAEQLRKAGNGGGR